MCTVCGCSGSDGGVRIEGGEDGWHTHADGTSHRHGDGCGAHGHDHDAGHGDAAAASRVVRVERDLLARNDERARRNREWFALHGIFAVNLVSSPGSGKTTLLVRTARELAGRLPLAVVEGDQQTSFDADRIRATGVPAIQVNTGKGCHLDAAMVRGALDRLRLHDDSLLMIENVGNLVCPAGFDLGEAHKVVVLSVTEGEDKPLKYPDMFAASSLMLLNKADLLPHLAFDVERCKAYARQVNPAIRIVELSATSGAGFGEWLAWVEAGVQAARAARIDQAAALQRRADALQSQLAPAR